MVSLAKQHQRKQGGDTRGDWRAKLIPHVPQVETLQAALSDWDGGVQHLEALLTHALLRAKSTWFPLASPWHHKAEFTLLAGT